MIQNGTIKTNFKVYILSNISNKMATLNKIKKFTGKKRPY